MLALLVANLKIMTRDRQAIFWALFFPLLLVSVFGVFDLDRFGSADLAIISGSDTGLSRELHRKLSSIDYLVIDPEYTDVADAKNAIADGDLEFLVVVPQGVEQLSDSEILEISDGRDIVPASPSIPVALTLYYDVNNTTANQLVIETIHHFVDEENLRLTGSPQLIQVLPQSVESRKVDYFDVLLIGLVGMGMMTNSIIFIAVKISLYRNQSILKRILATPLRVRNYFASEILAHLLLTLVQTAVVIGVGVYVFGANIHGNIVWVFVIAAFANTIFLNIGFIISGWANSPRAASGIGNAVVMPMLFFSGTFFPTSSLPSIFPHVVQVLPLTPMLDAMRAVAIDGEALWDVGPELGMLAGWLVVSSVAAIRLFRFG